MLSQLVEDNASRNSSVARASLSSDEKQTSNFGSAEIPEMRSEKSQDHDSSSRRRRHTLLSYDEIPSWYQDNPHIRRGYRPVSHSASACFDSLSYAHNETMNIFTHLIPAIGLLVCGLVYVSVRLRKHSGGDAGIVAALMLSEVACLGLSSMYHTLMCHSRAMESLWLRLDFVGIILLIFGSFVSSIYVGFWCEAFERTIYWSMVSGRHVLFGLPVIYLSITNPPHTRVLYLGSIISPSSSELYRFTAIIDLQYY